MKNESKQVLVSSIQKSVSSSIIIYDIVLIVNVNFVPLLSLDRHQISPPNTCVNFEQIDRPSPVPFMFLSILSFPIPNSLNRFC